MISYLFVHLKSTLLQLLLTILSCPCFPIGLLILLIYWSSLYIKGIKLLSGIYVANISLSLLLFLWLFFIKKTYFLLVYSVFSIIVSGFVSYFKNVFTTPRINFILYILMFFFPISNLFWCKEYDWDQTSFFPGREAAYPIIIYWILHPLFYWLEMLYWPCLFDIFTCIWVCFWDLKSISSIGSLKVKCRLKEERSGKVYVRRWCFSSDWQGLSDGENYSMCKGEDVAALEELTEWSLALWPQSQGASGERWGWSDGEGLDQSLWAMLEGLHLFHTIRSTWRVLSRGETQSILHSFLGGAVLGLHCCMDFSPVAVSRGYSLVVVLWLIAVASLIVDHGL